MLLLQIFRFIGNQKCFLFCVVAYVLPFIVYEKWVEHETAVCCTCTIMLGNASSSMGNKFKRGFSRDQVVVAPLSRLIKASWSFVCRVTYKNRYTTNLNHITTNLKLATSLQMQFDSGEKLQEAFKISNYQKVVNYMNIHEKFSKYFCLLKDSTALKDALHFCWECFIHDKLERGFV